MGSEATVLLHVAAIWTVAVVTPGPNFLVTVQTAVSRPRALAQWVVLGTATGTVVWGLAGFFGVSLLFAAAPWLHWGLRVAGGAYLVWLGARLLFGRGQAPGEAPAARTRGRAGWRAGWRLGFLTNLSNPKTAAFVTSLFAAALPRDPPLWLGLASVGLMAALSLAWYSVVARLFSSRRVAGAYLRGRRWVDRIAGAVFVGFGAALAARP